MARLNEKDLSLLSDGKTVSLGVEGGRGYAYLGGKFKSNPNDYVQVSIYDTNENFLESAIVNTQSYLYDYDANEIRLKTGAILRSMGYDRGRYVVKYYFLRKLAGSYENILVDENNNRYFDAYDTDEDTFEITKPNGDQLYLKEYKYFVHEISPSRREVRLVPQRINDGQDDKYNNDFYELQTEIKRMIPPSKGMMGDWPLRFVGDINVKGDSFQLEFVPDDGAESEPNFPSEIRNGTLVLNDVFLQPLKTDPPTGNQVPPTVDPNTGQVVDPPQGPSGGGDLPSRSPFYDVIDNQITLGNWTWYYFTRGYEGEDGSMVGDYPEEGWFKDSVDDGWYYYYQSAAHGRSFDYIPDDEWPSSFPP
jgi:hypothetical protein